MSIYKRYFRITSGPVVKEYKRCAEDRRQIPPENPIPCPFCGAKPDFQTAIDSQRGSWFEWECSGCYFVSISLQLDHHFMDEIGISDDGYDPKTLRFNTGTYVAILNYVVGLWNDRTDRVGGES